MANLLIGEPVEIAPAVIRRLRFPPTSTGELHIAVHPGAVNAPQSLHTQVVGLGGDRVVWLGALGEDLLASRAVPGRPDARSAVHQHLFVGGRLWEVVLPGPLLNPGVPQRLSTVYDGDRPWLVIGESATGDPIAVPLNEASNPKWYSPTVAQADLQFVGSKESQLELAHAWTVQASCRTIGSLSAAAIAQVRTAIERYYL